MRILCGVFLMEKGMEMARFRGRSHDCTGLDSREAQAFSRPVSKKILCAPVLYRAGFFRRRHIPAGAARVYLPPRRLGAPRAARPDRSAFPGDPHEHEGLVAPRSGRTIRSFPALANHHRPPPRPPPGVSGGNGRAQEPRLRCHTALAANQPRARNSVTAVRITVIMTAESITACRRCFPR